jgi:hypothetical protein
MQDWVGRETADIVYQDRDGSLTQYLRDNCAGDFPDQIRIDHDFEAHPIEYYLEVKTTTSACSTKFYLSHLQYKRVCRHVSLLKLTARIYMGFTNKRTDAEYGIALSSDT